MLDVIASAELSARLTLQPLERFDLDAAVIFSDILPPLRGMGLDIRFDEGAGPSISNPLSTTRDIDMLAVPPAEERLGSTLEAIRLVRAELEPRGIPVIGFAGAPFTLASYAIEGGGSKSYAKTKLLMYREPAAWERLMTRLVTVQVDYLLAQARAGASAVQVFDSWAGVALGREDYRRSVLPHNVRLFSALRAAGVPAINFSTGTAGYIEDVAEAGGDALGVDWRLPLDEYWRRIGYQRAIQGNLDPAALLAPWPELSCRADAVLDQAAGRPGHVFNLGHGVLPETPPDSVKRLVEHVHERSSR
jgi:uroporphyrinogen decarboxylase